MTVKKLAKRYGISPQGIYDHLVRGNIPGAYLDDRFGRWIIPDNAKIVRKDKSKRRRR